MLAAAAAHYLSEVNIYVVHKEADCIYRMYWIPFPGVKCQGQRRLLLRN